MVKGVGHFLEPGRHFLNNPNLTFIKMVPMTQEYTNVGAKHRIIISDGKIGLAWEQGKPRILEHGQVYMIDSPNFKYAKSVDLQSPVIEHGAIKMITVREGVYGISYNDGVMEILNPGRHILSKGTHSFAGFIPSGQQTLAIEAVTSMSADNVGIKFDSALTIQVVRPKLAVLNLGMVPNASANQQIFLLEQFYRNITAKAKLALSIIIGNNKLNQSFESTQRKPMTIVVGAGDEADDPEEVMASSFKQHVHDVFMMQFTSNMEKCGINVIDMSIEDVEITNVMLAEAMAKGAVAATELEKVRLEQISQITAAEGKSRAMQILAEAKAQSIRKLDEAMANVSQVTQQCELVRMSGEVMSKTQTTLVLADNIGALAPLLGVGGLKGAINGAGK
jgi:regulator of protease activity HflC (stomatin/prohibitin superfamily)